MTYDPFIRGEYPVGARTIELTDTSRDNRRLTIEIWYPATEEYKGKDLDEAIKDRFEVAPGLPKFAQQAVRDADTFTGKFPLIMYNHGALGNRRVNTVLCTHLASHGYIVAANDVPGTTLAEFLGNAAGTNGNQGDVEKKINRMRPGDASFVIESLIAGAEPSIAANIDADQIGACGHSSGGWTTIFLNSVNRRMKAAFAIEPMWGETSPLKEILEMSSWLPLDDWGRPVPTYILAGEADFLIMLEDLRGLYRKLPDPKRFAMLKGAGHIHFQDAAEFFHEYLRHSYMNDFPDKGVDGPALAKAMRPFSELCSEEAAADTMRGLCLAHFDENLKGNREAAEFLENNTANALTARGIDIEIAPRQEREAGV